MASVEERINGELERISGQEPGRQRFADPALWVESGREAPGFERSKACEATSGLIRVVHGHRAAQCESNVLTVLPSCRSHGTHAPQIRRQAHELELGLHPVQASQAELTQPEHALDPAVGRLGDPLALVR